MPTIEYPLRHLSIRVPWHDSGWDGTVCKQPKMNDACLILKGVSKNKREDEEELTAGQMISELPPENRPPCIAERGMFMSPSELTREMKHPYAETNPETHGHLRPTMLRFPPYSAAAVPYRWMRVENMKKFAEEYNLGLDPNREPDLPWETGWIQDKSNQVPLLDCFFSHVRRDQSLCFFYAKRIPIESSDNRRVIVGVGRVLSDVGPCVEYEFDGSQGIRCVLWEHMIHHSIRPGFKDGFLLPYREAFELAEEDPSFNPLELVAFAPEELWDEYSFAAEHLTHDDAIASLHVCATSLKRAKEFVAGPWDQALNWIDERLSELWKMRGPCPGLGSALCAFGIELGTFAAWEIANAVGEDDPWPAVDKAFADPNAMLSSHVARKFSKTLCETWKALPEERKTLLKMLSRMELTPAQAKALYVAEEREKLGTACNDMDIIENPYLAYELSVRAASPIDVMTVDRGVFPVDDMRVRFPLSSPSTIDSGTDTRRVRAITVELLERAAVEYGHTLKPQKEVIQEIREKIKDPPCEINSDILSVCERDFPGMVELAEMSDGTRAYQLDRLAKVAGAIRKAIKRVEGKRHSIEADWRQILDDYLGTEINDEAEERARQEKVAALEEIAAARLSVLVGPAGTGKTTLLSAFCGQESIAEGGILLLAPTGKARVRMEQAGKDRSLKAFTLAQFLNRHDRYDGKTQTYRLSDSPAVEIAETVIVDESSMLTEEMLAALFNSLKGVKRYVLVGDPRQLPPIGAGRPFVDIVRALEPGNVEDKFPRVAPGYAELTIHRRHRGKERQDLRLAEWFSGTTMGPGEDEIFDAVKSSVSGDNIRFIQWESEAELQDILLNILVEELGIAGSDDVHGFDLCLGGTESGEYMYFNRGAAANAENWQILSPVRGRAFGVTDINRTLHKAFRGNFMELARAKRYRKIPKPLGPEEIVYGDKVINVRNSRRKRVYPEDGALKYIANGEIGIAVGQFKSKKMKTAPWALKVEFSSQQGYEYDFTSYDFGELSDAKLELAYALTVHKAQGSQFRRVFLVLPNPCRLLSRELLYTALTRQEEKVIVLHQGDIKEMKNYSSDRWSETARRLTNLFQSPTPVEVEGHFLEEGLIHRTSRGEPVRSKSEVIIADLLAAHGIEYTYERPLTLGGQTRFPDFTIEDDTSGETYYWEHCGMMYDPAYRIRWEAKKEWYLTNGVSPWEDGGGEVGSLIVTEDSEKGGISSQDIDGLISKILD